MELADYSLVLNSRVAGTDTSCVQWYDGLNNIMNFGRDCKDIHVDGVNILASLSNKINAINPTINGGEFYIERTAEDDAYSMQLINWNKTGRIRMKGPHTVDGQPVQYDLAVGDYGVKFEGFVNGEWFCNMIIHEGNKNLIKPEDIGAASKNDIKSLIGLSGLECTMIKSDGKTVIDFYAAAIYSVITNITAGQTTSFAYAIVKNGTDGNHWQISNSLNAEHCNYFVIFKKEWN